MRVFSRGLVGVASSLLLVFCWNNAGKMFGFGSIAVDSLLDFRLAFDGRTWAGLMVDR